MSGTQRFGVRARRAGSALLIGAALLLNLNAVTASGPQKRNAKDQQKGGDEWPAYGRDGGGSRYAPVAQVTRDNVSKLRVALSPCQVLRAGSCASVGIGSQLQRNRPVRAS